MSYSKSHNLHFQGLFFSYDPEEVIHLVRT